MHAAFKIGQLARTPNGKTGEVVSVESDAPCENLGPIWFGNEFVTVKFGISLKAKTETWRADLLEHVSVNKALLGVNKNDHTN